MHAEEFVGLLAGQGIDYFTGVPDSLLSALPNYLMSGQDHSYQHIVAHNEGGCVALAAGYHLATGRVPCIYLQNSGIGNIINPVASLTHPKVYGVPMLFLVGWRGEPGVKDEPQHVFQGEATLRMLEAADLQTAILEKDTEAQALKEVLEAFAQGFAQGKSAALVVRKGALTGPKGNYTNTYTLNREAAVQLVAKAAGEDVLISTTGKISRELFEHRENTEEGHSRDFLTVGSMGHSVMIALGVAQAKPEQKVWCLDGDGAAIMHMGAMAIVGARKPRNLVHVVLNNAAHESVGGVPTAADEMDLAGVAKACGYRECFTAATCKDLEVALAQCRSGDGPLLLEVRVALGSRADLGRPTTTPEENKRAFMDYLQGKID